MTLSCKSGTESSQVDLNKGRQPRLCRLPARRNIHKVEPLSLHSKIPIMSYVDDWALRWI